jgi:hypothetical protein
MPDPAFDQSDTTLSWPRDLLAAHLGIALAANDPGQLLLRYGLTSFIAASIAALIADRSGRVLPATLLGDHPSSKRLTAFLDNKDNLWGERDFRRFPWLGELYDVLERAAPVCDSISTQDEVFAWAMDAKLQLRSAFVLALETTQQTFSLEVAYDLPGLSRQKRQADAQVALLFPPALAFIYLFLAAQFESFEDPVMVLVTVPFAIVGALPTLSVVPLVYSSISSRTRATMPESPASHPQTASSGGLVAVLDE